MQWIRHPLEGAEANFLKKLDEEDEGEEAAAAAAEEAKHVVGTQAVPREPDRFRATVPRLAAISSMELMQQFGGDAEETRSCCMQAMGVD
jgi:hypothetical protein